MSDLENTVSGGSLGVDDSLRNTLSSEMSELVNKVEVLDEERSIGASGHRVLVVVDGGTVGGSQSFTLHEIIIRNRL